MKKWTKVWLLILCLCVFSVVPAVAQTSCPSGTVKAEGFLATDPATGNALYPVCVNITTGSLFFQGELLTTKTMTVTEGVSPSYKAIYANLTVPAAVTGGTQNIKALQGVVTLNASSAPSEIWGSYGLINSSGAPVSVYGSVGEVDIVASTPSNAAFGLLGTYDGQVNITATPTPTGLFSAAVGGQVWDRDTNGPTAIFLALSNGDTNRKATHPIGAAFKAINRHISFATGFNYGLDLFIESGFSRGALIADVRLGTGATIISGSGVPAGGLCVAGNLGAIYLNHSGGAGTTLYVCEVAGAWAAK